MFFSKKLRSTKNLKHCFFSRKNGVSKGIYHSLNCGLGSKDYKKNVIDNIKIVRNKLSLQKKPIITLNQIHSNKVIYFDNYKEVKDKITGDAIISKLSNIGIAVLTADCVPILIYDTKKKIIGCIHAGWKGALGGVIENTIEKFLNLNSSYNDLIVAVGPCIDQKHYEVKYNFYKKFISQNKNNNKFFILLNHNKYLFNLRNYINSKLKILGIKKIDNIEMDTYSDEENFFSYRRSLINNDVDYGRCISVIIMT